MELQLLRLVLHRLLNLNGEPTHFPLGMNEYGCNVGISLERAASRARVVRAAKAARKGEEELEHEDEHEHDEHKHEDERDKHEGED
jgi:hypothetical protein